MFDLSGDYVLLDLICLVSFSTKTINGFPATYNCPQLYSD